VFKQTTIITAFPLDKGALVMPKLYWSRIKMSKQEFTVVAGRYQLAFIFSFLSLLNQQLELELEPEPVSLC
jgi:hypothetical protein